MSCFSLSVASSWFRQREQQDIQYVLPPQRSDPMGREYAHDPRAQGPVYAPASEIHPHGQMTSTATKTILPESTGLLWRQPPNAQCCSYCRSSADSTIRANRVRKCSFIRVFVGSISSGSCTTTPATTSSHSSCASTYSRRPPATGAVYLCDSCPGGPPGQMAQVSSPGGYAYWHQSDVPTSNAQTMSPTLYMLTRHRGRCLKYRWIRQALVADDHSRKTQGVRLTKAEQQGAEEEAVVVELRSTRLAGRPLVLFWKSFALQKVATGPSSISKVCSKALYHLFTQSMLLVLILFLHLTQAMLLSFARTRMDRASYSRDLEVGDLKEKQIVITEVLPEVQYLRNDVFGNYVVQKLLEFGTPEMRADLRDTLKGEMLALVTTDVWVSELQNTVAACLVGGSY